MRTRCPACSTTFRVTSEQLRLKAGKVRCGQCLAVFNAFESLIEEEAATTPTASPVHTTIQRHEHATPLASPVPAEPPSVPAPPPRPAPPPPEKLIAPSVLPDPAPPTSPPEDTAADTTREESIAESSLAAREAGLVAARELADTPAYNRWAAGTLAGDGHIRIDTDTPKQVVWPFTIAFVFLASLLALQLLYEFRTHIVQRLPEMQALYALAAVDVPLPRNPELVGIEVSDLQSDNARGLLVLQATLRNRATFAQAWPALELTLTDTHDTVISRRVLHAEEYLPPGADQHAFPARNDMAIRLWLEAKGVGAAGYRLYLFYP